LPHRSSSLASLHQCSLEQQKEDENKKNENEERLFIDYRLEIKLQKNQKKNPSFLTHTFSTQHPAPKKLAQFQKTNQIRRRGKSS
jgi:hypothetical protein